MIIDNKEVTEQQVENEAEDWFAVGIKQELQRAISDLGYTKLTPIQKQAIPCLVDGQDLLGQAQTGTGKTAAFAIPVIQNIDKTNPKVQALVLCPTRELAIQAAGEFRKLTKYTQGVKVLPIYGGQNMGLQIRDLHKKVSVVVGTPGRVMDHLRRGTLKLDDVNFVVLDEADEMLDMGFREDMETILSQVPAGHQTALFSATMPSAIKEIAEHFLDNYTHIQIAAKELTVPQIKQYYYMVKHATKDEIVSGLLTHYQPKQTLVFCNTKRKVDEVSEKLKSQGYRTECLHGDLRQMQRDRVMKRIRGGEANVLVATDVAARGIDIDTIEAVINYDLPREIEYYVHRIGRTGRAGRSGRSFSLVARKELERIHEIERVCKTTLEERSIPEETVIDESNYSRKPVRNDHKNYDKSRERKPEQQVREPELELIKPIKKAEKKTDSLPKKLRRDGSADNRPKNNNRRFAGNRQVQKKTETDWLEEAMKEMELFEASRKNSKRKSGASHRKLG